MLPLYNQETEDKLGRARRRRNRSDDVKIQVARLVRSCSSGKVLEGPSLRRVVRQENLPASLNRCVYLFTYKTCIDDPYEDAYVHRARRTGATTVADLSVDIFSGDFYYVLILSRIHFADAWLPNERTRDTRIARQNLPCV